MEPLKISDIGPWVTNNIPSSIKFEPINIPSMIGLPPSMSCPNLDLIKIEVPKIPSIIINWPPPPNIVCHTFVLSPGDTNEDYCKLQEKHGCKPSAGHKCEAIVEKLVEIINSREKISFEWDIGGWTATVQQGKMRAKVGKPSGNYQDFVDDLYNLLLKRNSDGM